PGQKRRKRAHSTQYSRLGDRSDHRRKERTKGRGWQDRNARASAEPGGNFSAVTAARHLVAGAAQHGGRLSRRFEIRRGGFAPQHQCRPLWRGHHDHTAMTDWGMNGDMANTFTRAAALGAFIAFTGLASIVPAMTAETGTNMPVIQVAA